MDQSVRRALGLPLRGGEMLQPWFSRKNGPPPPALGPLTLAFEVEAVPDGPVSLCLERPDLWRITLNGRAIPSEAQVRWVDTAFQKIALPPDALAVGGNVLTPAGDFHQDVNLEAVAVAVSNGTAVHYRS